MKNGINVKNANRGLTKKSVETATATLLNNFDYESLVGFTEDEKNTLKNNVAQLQFHANNIGNELVEIGRILEESRVLFSRHPESDSYTEWYKSLGLNKDQVLQGRALYRAQLQVEATYPNDEEKVKKIKSLSGRAVVEMNKKYKDKNLGEKIVKELVEFVVTSEKVPSSADLKKVRIELEEKNSHIEEAEIVETKKTRLKLLNEEKNDLEKYIKKNIDKAQKLREELEKIESEIKIQQGDLKVIEKDIIEEEKRIIKETKAKPPVVKEKKVVDKKVVKKETIKNQ